MSVNPFDGTPARDSPGFSYEPPLVTQRAIDLCELFDNSHEINHDSSFLWSHPQTKKKRKERRKKSTGCPLDWNNGTGVNSIVERQPAWRANLLTTRTNRLEHSWSFNLTAEWMNLPRERERDPPPLPPSKKKGGCTKAWSVLWSWQHELPLSVPCSPYFGYYTYGYINNPVRFVYSLPRWPIKGHTVNFSLFFLRQLETYPRNPSSDTVVPRYINSNSVAISFSIESAIRYRQVVNRPQSPEKKERKREREREREKKEASINTIFYYYHHYFFYAEWGARFIGSVGLGSLRLAVS